MAVFRVDVPEEIERVFEKYDRTLMRRAFFREIFNSIVNKTSITSEELEKRVKCIVFGDFDISFCGGSARPSSGSGSAESITKLDGLAERFRGGGR